MTESERPLLLNVGGNQVEKAIYIEPESAAIERLTELRDAGKLDISELPTISIEFIFESTLLSNKLDILEFILDSNPLNAANRQIYKVFLNKKPPLPNVVSILNRAIVRQKVSLIQKLIAYGADVNEVHSDGMKPLDFAGRTTVEIYNILKTAGASSAGDTIFAKNAAYPPFLVHFTGKDLETKKILALFSVTNRILPSLAFHNNFRLDEPLLIQLFKYSNGILTADLELGKPSPIVMNELWDTYREVHGFDSHFRYDAPKIPMFSQKGMTCVTDAIFTVLLESPKLSPLWTSIDDSKASNSISSNYIGMFKAAQVRHARFATRNLPRGALRREQSVQNNVWKSMHEKMSCPEGGVKHEKISDFLLDIFRFNTLQIPALETVPFRIIDTTPTNVPFFDYGINPARIVAILIQADTFDGKDSHMYGFFRKADNGWMIADNEVGFLHTVQDNTWVNETFLWRLNYTVKTPTLDDLESKVLIALRKMDPIDLQAQFITLGDKCYPNIFIQEVFSDMKYLSIPTAAIYIVENPPAYDPYSAGAATYAVAASLGPYGVMMPELPAAPNYSDLARRLEALREHRREPVLNLTARLEALRGEAGSKEGGRRKTRRHSKYRGKTISRRK